MANFTVASTPRSFDRQTGEWKDGETAFLRCNAWRDMAENIAESVGRGTRLMVQGEKRTVVELDVDEVGVSFGSPRPR